MVYSRSNSRSSGEIARRWPGSYSSYLWTTNRNSHCRFFRRYHSQAARDSWRQGNRANSVRTKKISSMALQFCCFHLYQCFWLPFGDLPLGACGTNKPPATPFKKRIRRLRLDPRPSNSLRSIPNPLKHKRHNISQISLSDVTEKSSSTKHSSVKQTSALLTKLPPDIRSQIFKLVLGGNRFHLVHVWKGVGHVRCDGSCELPKANADAGWCPMRPGRPCHPWMKSTPWDATGKDKLQCDSHHVTDRADYSLVLTCKQIYVEAINLLYSENIFELDSIFVLNFFQIRVRPQRFRAIRHLQLYWVVESQDEVYMEASGKKGDFWTGAWDRFWRTVATDMQLETLFVQLDRTNGRKDDAFCAILNTMLQVRGLTTCEIYEPALGEESTVNTNELSQKMCLPKGEDAEPEWLGQI